MYGKQCCLWILAVEKHDGELMKQAGSENRTVRYDESLVLKRNDSAGKCKTFVLKQESQFVVNHLLARASYCAVID